MPDGFALAALSFALRHRVEQIIREHDVAVTGQFEIVTRSPEQLSAITPSTPTISVYPYSLMPNPGWESSRQSAYSSSGQRKADPLLALDAHYVLAGYAPDTGEIERVLGLALLAMHETSRLSPEMLEDASANGSFPSSSPLPQALLDLAAQPAPIKISPLPLQLEEGSQLWSTLNSGVRTGMAYHVGTILMERKLRRSPAPPVREGRLGVVQIKRPTIVNMELFDAALNRFVERSMVMPGENFRASGSGLTADVTQFVISNRTLAVDPATARSDLVEGQLPADLRPGITSFQLLHRLDKPEGELAPPASGDIPGERSNLIPLAVRPVLDDPAITLANRTDDDGVISFDATAHFSVDVGQKQRAELFLDATSPDADGNFASFTFVAPNPPAGSDDLDTATRQFTIRNVPAGTYLVRLVIDGADSELTMSGGASSYDGPSLDVPA